MASWLNKASGIFQRSTAGGGSQREPYQFVCDCGKRITGLRESRFQQFPCEACGTVVFVLPVNVYPRPVATQKKVERTSSDPRLSETVRQPPSDTGVNDLAETPPPPTRPKKAALDVSGGVRPRRKESGPKSEPTPRTGLELPRHRRWTPIRIVLAVIGLLVLATGLGLGWRWRVEQARTTLPIALEHGLAAFGERNFVEAARELGRAKTAAEILGRRDAEAVAIRQRWREARAARDMPPFMLADWLQDCLTQSDDERPAAGGSPADRIRGTWLVLDVSVAYDAKSQEPAAEVLLMAGETPVAVDLPLPEAVRRLAADERPTRVIVGAQVAQFQPPTAENVAGRLEFVPSSVFLWTDYDTYRAIGFETSAEEEPVLRELFATQSRWEEAAE